MNLWNNILSSIITICKIVGQWEFAVWLRELKPRLCNNLEGWGGEGGGGRFRSEGTCVYLWLIHVDVWRKPTQYCKAIILQFKINKWKYIQISNNSALKSEKGNKALRNLGLHGRLFPFEFWFYHLLLVWPWTSDFSSMSQLYHLKTKG